MSRRQVLDEHNSRELSEWLTFDRAFGLSLSGDMQAGIITAAVWNSQGGLPAEGSKEKRAATPADFFPALAAEGEQREPEHEFHDEAVELEVELEVELVPVEDEESEAERATRAMKNQWALFGLRHNAALRAAKALEAGEAGEPPDQPEMN